MFTVSSLRNFWYQDEIVEYDFNSEFSSSKISYERVGSQNLIQYVPIMRDPGKTCSLSSTLNIYVYKKVFFRILSFYNAV